MIRRWSMSVTLCAAVFFAAAPTARAGEWDWSLTPYLWTTGVSLDATANSGGVGVEAPFSDLVDKLDLGALLHFEGRNGRAGFFLQTDYFKLSDDKSFLDSSPIVDGGRVETELEQLIGEAGGFYRVTGDDEHGLDLLFGLRLLALSTDLDFDFDVAPDQSISSDSSSLDGFAGLRYLGAISERWTWWIRGDAGAGDTDLSWKLGAGFGVGLGRKGNKTLLLGYRHLAYENDEKGDAVHDTELSYSGGLIGFQFGF